VNLDPSAIEYIDPTGATSIPSSTSSSTPTALPPGAHLTISEAIAISVPATAVGILILGSFAFLCWWVVKRRRRKRKALSVSRVVEERAEERVDFVRNYPWHAEELPGGFEGCEAGGRLHRESNYKDGTPGRSEPDGNTTM
jgi:hypothetical protein